jgi:DNA primase
VQLIDLVYPYLSRVTGGHPNLSAICPFHEDPSSSTPSFSFNIETGLWHCFGCGRAGNLRSFLQEVGVPKETIATLVEPYLPQIARNERRSRLTWRNRFKNKNPFLAEPVLPDALLGMFDYLPLSLLEAGFSAALLNRVEVGFDKVHHRVIFPVRDLYGNLAGVSGRASGNEWPRFKVYQGGDRTPGDYGPEFDSAFPHYRFLHKRFLWNADRVYPYLVADPSRPLIITEGFKACLWVEQHLRMLTVAAMGASFSSEQLDTLLYITDGPVYLMLDNDAAGKRGTFSLSKKLLKQQNRCYVCELPEKQPDTCSVEQLKRAITEARRIEQWLRLANAAREHHARRQE